MDTQLHIPTSVTICLTTMATRKDCVLMVVDSVLGIGGNPWTFMALSSGRCNLRTMLKYYGGLVMIRL